MKINVAPGIPLTEAELLFGGEAVDGLTGDLASCEGVGGVAKLSAFQTGLDGTAVLSEGEGCRSTRSPPSSSTSTRTGSHPTVGE